MAIDRMKAGLPCETWFNDWYPTLWKHFDDPSLKFRKPPEPRREAREWRGVVMIRTRIGEYENLADPIHVREVLPGDVTLQPMTWEEADDLCSGMTGGHELLRALGLIREEGT